MEEGIANVSDYVSAADHAPSCRIPVLERALKAVWEVLSDKEKDLPKRIETTVNPSKPMLFHVLVNLMHL